MRMGKHASTKPSEAEKGGGSFGFPAGSVVKVTAASWTEWGEAGETALKGGREAQDPALKVTGNIDGVDEERSVFLGAGKRKRGLYPSKDGEFLDIEDGASATAIADGCNADIFLRSISDKEAHGRMAVPEDLHDDGISAVLVGLKFVAGFKVIKREGIEGQPRPTLVAQEILSLPDAAGGGKSSGKSAGKKKVDASSEAEAVVLAVLENPKYKKGVPVEKLWNLAYNETKGNPNQKEMLALIEDSDWIGDDRPWQVKGKGEDAVLLPV